MGEGHFAVRIHHPFPGLTLCLAFLTLESVLRLVCGQSWGGFPESTIARFGGCGLVGAAGVGVRGAGANSAESGSAESGCAGSECSGSGSAEPVFSGPISGSIFSGPVFFRPVFFRPSCAGAVVF
jgi:hypothetical protein